MNPGEEFLTHFCDMIRKQTGSSDEEEVLYIAKCCLEQSSSSGKVPAADELVQLVHQYSREWKLIDEAELRQSLAGILNDSGYGELAQTIVDMLPKEASSRKKLALVQDIGAQLIVLYSVNKHPTKDDIRKAVAKGMLLNEKKIEGKN